MSSPVKMRNKKAWTGLERLPPPIVVYSGKLVNWANSISLFTVIKVDSFKLVYSSLVFAILNLFSFFTHVRQQSKGKKNPR